MMPLWLVCRLMCGEVHVVTMDQCICMPSCSCDECRRRALCTLLVSGARTLHTASVWTQGRKAVPHCVQYIYIAIQHMLLLRQVSVDRAYLTRQMAKERHLRYDDTGEAGAEGQIAPYPFF